MPGQTREAAISFIAIRKALAGEPSHIVSGTRLVDGNYRQFIGFFDAAGLEQWLRDGGQFTPDDGLNCVFRSFRRDGDADRYYLPWAFPQPTVASAGLFARPNSGSARTIRIPGVERIAWFVDGAGDRLQPLGQRLSEPPGALWKAAIPRLLLDLANPEDPTEALGSSILIILPRPGTERKRPDYIVVDHRLRHPLNAHAVGDAPGDTPRTAAAVQTRQANISDPWMRHGDVRYPQLAFWAAGVSERNRQTAKPPTRPTRGASRKWPRTATGAFRRRHSTRSRPTAIRMPVRAL